MWEYDHFRGLPNSSGCLKWASVSFDPFSPPLSSFSSSRLHLPPLPPPASQNALQLQKYPQDLRNVSPQQQAAHWCLDLPHRPSPESNLMRERWVIERQWDFHHHHLHCPTQGPERWERGVARLLKKQKGGQILRNPDDKFLKAINTAMMMVECISVTKKWPQVKQNVVRNDYTKWHHIFCSSFQLPHNCQNWKWMDGKLISWWWLCWYWWLWMMMVMTWALGRERPDLAWCRQRALSTDGDL